MAHAQAALAARRGGFDPAAQNHERLDSTLLNFVGATTEASGARFDAAGALVDALWDPDGSKVAWVSGVTQHGDKLFFGNLAGDHVSVYALDA